MFQGLQQVTVLGVEEDLNGNAELYVRRQYVCLDYHNRLHLVHEELKRINKELDMRHNSEMEQQKQQYQEIQADLEIASIASKPIPALAVASHICQKVKEMQA